MSRAMYTNVPFRDHWVSVGAVSYGRGIALIRRVCCVVGGDSTKFHSTEHSILGTTHFSFLTRGNARFRMRGRPRERKVDQG